MGGGEGKRELVTNHLGGSGGSALFKARHAALEELHGELGQHQHELIGVGAGQHVILAALVAQFASDGLKNILTPGAAEAPIEFGETLDRSDNHRQRIAATAQTGDFTIKRQEEPARIVEPGNRIDIGLLAGGGGLLCFGARGSLQFFALAGALVWGGVIDHAPLGPLVKQGRRQRLRALDQIEEAILRGGVSIFGRGRRREAALPQLSQRGDQTAGVGMAGILENLIARAVLDDRAGIENRHAAAQRGHSRQIVRDHQNAGAQFAV